MPPIFEWDASKDASNQQKHGISFSEARLAFLDPFNITLPDPDHSIEEERFVLLGFAKRQVLIVVYAERSGVIRIISCRRANTKERSIYEETDDTMRDHYDFSQGVRGKYQHLIEQPQTVRIQQTDGTVTEEVISPAIELDPDVRKYFPTSEAVNKALRGLIALIPDESSSSHSSP